MTNQIETNLMTNFENIVELGFYHWLKGKGFGVINTGGGCTGWSLLTEDTEILVTCDATADMGFGGVCDCGINLLFDKRDGSDQNNVWCKDYDYAKTQIDLFLKSQSEKNQGIYQLLIHGHDLSADHCCALEVAIDSMIDEMRDCIKDSVEKNRMDDLETYSERLKLFVEIKEALKGPKS